MNLKKGNTVQIITGKNKGKKGKVLNVAKGGEYLVVEKVNIVTKHVKANPTLKIAGGIKKFEGKIHRSNVKIVKE